MELTSLLPPILPLPGWVSQPSRLVPFAREALVAQPRKWCRRLRKWVPHRGDHPRPHPVRWSPRVGLLGGNYNWVTMPTTGKDLYPGVKIAPPEWRIAPTGLVRGSRIYLRRRVSRGYRRWSRRNPVRARRRALQRKVRRPRRFRTRTLYRGVVVTPPGRPPLEVGLWVPTHGQGYHPHWLSWRGRRRVQRRRVRPVGLTPGGPTWGFRTRRLRGLLRWRRRVYRGYPTQRAHFQQDYLRGLTQLVGSHLNSRIPYVGPSRGVSNRAARLLTFRGWRSYFLTPPKTYPKPWTELSQRPWLNLKWSLGWTSRKVSRRRFLKKTKLISRPVSIRVNPVRAANLLMAFDGANQWLRARVYYRQGRLANYPRLRKGRHFLDYHHQRGHFRRVPPGWPLTSIWSPRHQLRRQHWRRQSREAQLLTRRRHRNRKRRSRRKRRRWGDRKLWRTLRQNHHWRPRWRRFPHAVISRRNLLGWTSLVPQLRRRRKFRRYNHWWSWLVSPRQNRIRLSRRRRERQPGRSPWLGIRLATQISPVGGYLRRRRKYLGVGPLMGAHPRGRGRRPARGVLRRRLRPQKITVAEEETPPQIHPRQRRWLNPVGKPPSWASPITQIHRWRGLFVKKGKATVVDHLLRQFRRSTKGIFHLYLLFHTSLGARTRRRGGALLKVPALVQTYQSWGLVRRWFVRGVSTRGDRSWEARVLHEGVDPVRTARARGDFIRGALLNSALL